MTNTFLPALAIDLPRLEETKVFPSPGNGLINFSFPLDLEAATTVNVFDLRGGLVLSKPLVVSGRSGYIDIRQLASGQYLILIDTPSGRFFARYVRL